MTISTQMSEKEESSIPNTSDESNSEADNRKEAKEREPVLVGAGSTSECNICKSVNCKHKNSEITPLLPGNKKRTDTTKPSASENEAGADYEDTVEVDLSKPGKDIDHHSPASWDLKQGLKELFEKSPEDLVGQTIANRYAMLSIIGKGGMSAVYSAKDLKLNKILALKLLLPHLASKQLTAKRFQIEAQAASSLYHPNLITIHDYGVTSDGIPYIAMDLLDGKSLSEILKEDGYLDPKRAVPIFIQICDALAHAHGKNVLHRDLKPSNVMVTTTNSKFEFVKLVDFGIAKMLPANDEESIQLTKTGEIFGSPQYMSPEQCSSQPMDARSDLYSMGCLMYELLSGKPPFHQDNMMETLFSQMNDSPPDFKKVNPDLDIQQQLQVIVFKCLAKLPADRYQSATELAQELNRFNQTATDIFIKQVQAKWQVFKLKTRPLKGRERKILAIALFLSTLLLIASFKLLSTYFSDDNSMKKIASNQLFMPSIEQKKEIPTVTVLPTRAMESGLSRRLKNLEKKTESSEIISLIEDSESVAKAFEKLHQYDLARKYHKCTIALYKKFGDSETSSSYSMLLPQLSIGKCFFAEGNYKNALPYFDKYTNRLRKFADNPRDRFELAQGLAFKASCEYAIGNYKSAVRTYSKFFALIPKTDRPLSKQQTGLLYSQYGDSYRLLRSYKQAISAFTKAKRAYQQEQSKGTIFNTTNQNRMIIANYLNAYCYYKLLRYKKAAPLYKDVLPKMKKLTNKYKKLRIAATSQYADILWKLHNYPKSIEMSFQAKELKKLQEL